MILSISDINVQLKLAYRYLIVSIICAFIGGIYELFSHEVYSYYMIYAFAFPLVLGAFPWLTIGLFKKDFLPNKSIRTIFHCGIATLTIGSIFKGVLEIFGTTNPLNKIYWIAGSILILLGLILLVTTINEDAQKEAEN